MKREQAEAKGVKLFQNLWEDWIIPEENIFFSGAQSDMQTMAWQVWIPNTAVTTFPSMDKVIEFNLSSSTKSSNIQLIHTGCNRANFLPTYW